MESSQPVLLGLPTPPNGRRSAGVHCPWRHAPRGSYFEPATAGDLWADAAEDCEMQDVSTAPSSESSTIAPHFAKARHALRKHPAAERPVFQNQACGLRSRSLDTSLMQLRLEGDEARSRRAIRLAEKRRLQAKLEQQQSRRVLAARPRHRAVTMPSLASLPILPGRSTAENVAKSREWTAFWERKSTTGRSVHLDWEHRAKEKDAAFAKSRSARGALQDRCRAEVDLLPPLTHAELERLSWGMDGGSEAEVLFSRFNVDFKRSQLQCLQQGSWLNDEVVNQYFGLLRRRSVAEAAAANKGLEGNVGRVRSAYFFSTFFKTKLEEAGYTYSNVRKWTKRGSGKCDIFGEELVVIPVHVGTVHWCLCVVFVQEKRIVYYDSMGGGGQGCLEMIKQWVCDEHLDKKKTPLPNADTWCLESPCRSVPQQHNGCDCGVFMSTFANYLGAGKREFSFSQADMAYMRQRIGVDVIAGTVAQG